MEKPNVYVINWGGIGAVDSASKLGDNAYRADTTVGLIEYKKDGNKKFMLIDVGMAASWPVIKENLEKHGSLDQVTHILMTHWDQDHGQNLKELPGALALSRAGTARINTLDFGQIADLYPKGYIENEHIKYIETSSAHSRDEIVYLIDSENEGLVVFLGDLIFAPCSVVPVSNLIGFDTGFTINPIKKYLFLKKLAKDYPELSKAYVGHYNKPLSYNDLAQHVKDLESEEYQKFLSEFIDKQGQENEKLKSQLKFYLISGTFSLFQNPEPAQLLDNGFLELRSNAPD